MCCSQHAARGCHVCSGMGIFGLRWCGSNDLRASCSAGVSRFGRILLLLCCVGLLLRRWVRAAWMPPSAPLGASAAVQWLLGRCRLRQAPCDPATRQCPRKAEPYGRRAGAPTPPHRRWHLRHATMGLVPALCLGAMWAIFFAQERQTPGAPSLAPTWLQVCALGFLLSILGWLFVDVVMTVRAVRGGI